MARTTLLVDDMDGQPNAKERHFSIGGSDYRIDLHDDNYSAMLKTMEPWRSLASIARKSRKKTHDPLTKDERVKIRAWAKENGRDLADRGRFPDHLVQDYYQYLADSASQD